MSDIRHARDLAGRDHLEDRVAGIESLLLHAGGQMGTPFEQARARQILERDLEGVSVVVSAKRRT